jgi:hypothetical protein
MDDSSLIEGFAARFLGLDLTRAEAEALAPLLASQKLAIEVLESVSVADDNGEFVTPRAGDERLERGLE